jgi:hypothetical protein
MHRLKTFLHSDAGAQLRHWIDDFGRWRAVAGIATYPSRGRLVASAIASLDWPQWGDEPDGRSDRGGSLCPRP